MNVWSINYYTGKLDNDLADNKGNWKYAILCPVFKQPFTFYTNLMIEENVLNKMAAVWNWEYHITFIHDNKLYSVL